MKKLYRKGAVHPSSPPASFEDQHLSLLSATLLTLTAALSPQDKQVLAYLISCTTNNKACEDHHHAMFSCHCFSCYTTYWARWDASPNRQVIHEIIEAFEDELLMNNKKTKKNKKKKDTSETPKFELSGAGASEHADDQASEEVVANDGEEIVVVDDKGSLRKFMSLICEKIWSVFGHNQGK